jgi:NAD(P)-dependent dehydrogenase (short-subunit alcohol dehydrogenase family)
VTAPPLVYITGASSGIGQALAERYLQAGWRLALVARRPQVLREWAAARGAGPECCQIYEADVRRGDEIAAAGRACIAAQGLPDVVIANAGISEGVDTSDGADLPVFDDIVSTNLTGLAATFQPFIGPMRQRRGGRLVGMASVAAIRGLPGHGAYCASKAGVVAYCESLRIECRSQGVRVLTVLPGYIATPMTARNSFWMPFLLTAPAFAKRAFAAIEAGRAYQVIPWQMGLVAALMRLLPNAVFDRLAAGRGRKPRRAR